MTKIIDKITKVSSSNGVFVVLKKSDIEQLSFLKLDTAMTKKVSNCFTKKENTMLQFFIGTKRFESIFIIISQEKNIKLLTQFLGKSFLKLPKNYTLFSHDTETVKSIVDTCLLSRYKFQNYKKKKDEHQVYIHVTSGTKKSVEERLHTIKNIELARDLGETPSNDLTPQAFANMIKKTKFKKVKVKIISPKDIEKKGLGLIHAVGKGSENKPYMVIMERIVDKKAPIQGIVGKGITFDSGGIQVKPESHMYEMKGDMGGAAVTYALMKELDRLDIQKNVVACICLAENAISSTSYKPSDIITGYTGKTVEIIHTDAEGRLVLADGVSYVSKNYKTSNMMTIATLTGAVMVALGYRYAGVMGSDTKLINALLNYSKTNTEQYVELPIDEHFMEKTESKIADYKNLDRGVYAGSSMGGAFLSNFLENDEKYTHIDIAGAYLNGGDPYGKVNVGATGFGVESLSEVFQQI